MKFALSVLTVGCYLFSLPALAQVMLQGRVVDDNDKSPLAFVAVVANDDPQLGVITDIDGKFLIETDVPVTSLRLRYVGYEPLRLDITSEESLVIEMTRKSVLIREVVIVAGENPAHRIISKVIANRKINDPKRLPSFSYTSYNKFYMTANVDSMRRDSAITISAGAGGSGRPRKAREPQPTSETATDTGKVSGATRFLESHYLFLMETISERVFKQPDKTYEKVIANRVAGLKNPTFFILATQLQSFDFYDDYFSLLGKNYLSPVTTGGTRNYFFNIEDTAYAGSDTVFIISYRPKQGKNFDGLKGVLYINTNTYAIQSVLAEPAQESGTRIRVQQNYSFIGNAQWFPTQLNTDMDLRDAVVNGASILAVGRTYLEDIAINPELRGRDFGHVAVEVDPKATKRADTVIAGYRPDTLSVQERNTYQFIDSVGEVENFDLILSGIRVILDGKMRFGIINWDWTRSVGYNTSLGWSLGLGLETNERLSKRFNLGGHVSYAFRAKTPQYGGFARLNVSHRHEITAEAGYEYARSPAGEISFHDDLVNVLDKWLISTITPHPITIDEYRFTVGFRAIKYLTGKLRLAAGSTTAGGEYLFVQNFGDVRVGRNTIWHSTATASLRYAFKEKVVLTPQEVFSLGTRYPIVWLDVERSLPAIWSQLDYWRLSGKIMKSLLLKKLGTLTVALTAGYVFGEAPYYRNFIVNGSREKWSWIWVRQAFNTMTTNEFLSDEFVTAQVRHDFGRLIFGQGKKVPGLQVVTSVALGRLNSSQAHQGIRFKTLEHGYYESGIVLDRIIRFNYFNVASIGYGLGVFYRYGAYALDPWWKNVALRLTLSGGI